MGKVNEKQGILINCLGLNLAFKINSLYLKKAAKLEVSFANFLKRNLFVFYVVFVT